MLAVRSGQTPAWRLLNQGDALPEECELCSGAVGDCPLQLPGAWAKVAPDTHLQLALKKRQAGFERGRLFLRTAAERWAVKIHGLTVAMEPQSAVELTAGDVQPARVRVVEGRATATPDDGKPTVAGAGTTLDWEPSKKTLAVASLAEAERKQILAEAASRPQPQGLGQMLIKDAQSESMVRLEVARYHVHVVLQPPVALVQIDQSFYNPHGQQEEGTFVFNLPRGASVSRFAMYVTPTELIEGELIERQQAAGIYQSIVNRRRDPAILEQIGDNLFRMRVFPVPAQDTKRILLDYTIPLDIDHNECRFRLPLLSDLNPIWDFRLSGAIKGPTMRQSAVSLSHPDIKFTEQAEGTIGFQWQARNYRPEQDFDLRLLPRSDGKPTLRSYLASPLPPPAWPPNARNQPADKWSNRSATYFLAAIPPEETKVTDTSPADVLILADTSAGLRGNRLLRQVVPMIVHNLRVEDRFRLVCVDAVARPLGDAWAKAGSAEGRAVLARFEDQFCLGGTDLVESFASAVACFDPGSSRRRLVVYVGDGEDTLAEAHAEPFERRLSKQLDQAKAALFSVAVRRDRFGLGMLESISEAHRGQVFDLTTGSEGNQALLRWLLEGLPRPQQVLVQADGIDSEDLFYPRAWPAGQWFYVYGRTSAVDRVHLTLDILDKQKPLTRHWDFACSDSDDVFVGRLWAQKKLDGIIRKGSSDPAAEVALSREWSLLSPLTAFLVLESEDDYRRWNVDRQQRRRYWKPPEAVAQEPLPEAWLALVKPSPTEKRKKPPTAEQLTEAMATIKAETFAACLGAHRALLDPGQRLPWLTMAPTIRPLLAVPLLAPPDFVRRHPHYQQLLQNVRIEKCVNPDGKVTIQELCELLRLRTTANVLLDEKALNDVGLEPGGQITICGWGTMSLRQFARLALKRVDLTMVEEPRGLLVTTAEEAETQRITEIYPVEGLYTARRPSDPRWLADPYLDRQLAAERRIQSKLARPVSVVLNKMPLNDAIQHFATLLDDTVVLDDKALSDVGIALNTPVNLSLRDLPVKESLRWMLRSLDLTYLVDGDALVITTPEEAETREKTRLHSCRGVIYESAMPPGMPTGFGMFGGMGGGMGAMGAMGGFGGGFGGMAGFGGGFGGMGGGFGGSSRDATIAAGISFGGETVPAEAEAEPRGAEVPEAPPPSEPVTPGAREATYSRPDFDSSIDMITSTIQPTTWDSVGGPGSVAGFGPTLDLVVTATDDVHEEIEDLFQRLRQVPLAVGAEGRVRLVETPREVPQSARNMDDLIDVITSNVQPTTWDEVGGPGSITSDEARMALVLSQTQEVHDGVGQLLCLLRRSRYESLFGQRPWETATVSTGLVFGETSADALASERRFSMLPEPQPRELAALKARRRPVEGRWTWRYSEPARKTPRTLTLHAAGARLELTCCDVRFRIEGDAVASADPRLGLVEHGNWAEAVLERADVWLPWLPHRSNEELARLFEIQPLEATSADRKAGACRLRLVVPGQTEPASSYLEITLSESDGRLRSWEAFFQGKLTGRLRVADPAEGADWSTVVLEDAAGKPLARWELIESHPAEPIPELTAGWDGYVQLDRRTPQPAVDPAFHHALAAMKEHQWDRVSQELALALKEHPRHPLLFLLSVWCYDQDHRFGSREAMRELLQGIAASRAAGLTRFVAEHGFAWLEPQDLCEILARMPTDVRQVEDWDRLARVATEAGRREEALQYVEAALAAADDPSAFARHRSRVELLLKLGRQETAVKAAQQWATAAPASPGQLATMGELLAAHGCQKAGDALFREALAVEHAPESRYSLLRRRAELAEGLSRWKMLLEAAALRPADSSDRQGCVAIVTAELNQPPHAEVAAMLAEKTPDPQLRAALWIRQAELTADEALAAQLVWTVHQAGRLADEHLVWAYHLWNAAGQGAWTIADAEQRLRSGGELPTHACRELARAYRAAGREQDARRADTFDSDPNNPQEAVPPDQRRSVGFF